MRCFCVYAGEGSSPLTRGAPDDVVGRRWACGLIPAHAGSTVVFRRGVCRPGAHPRSRGEHMMQLLGRGVPVGSSPLTRGALRHFPTGVFARGLIPAHAGSTATNTWRTCLPWAHPRSRGEHPSFAKWRAGRRGLIPAHAGSTGAKRMGETLSGAHPRSRGEHCGGFDSEVVQAGSSPLTRGARDWDGHNCHHAGLIPAHAGSTSEYANSAAVMGAHPRSRGEHWGSVWVPGGRVGLIPAHAGSTTLARSPTCPAWAHPRSRGEHGKLQGDDMMQLGSSPLTRGALY